MAKEDYTNFIWWVIFAFIVGITITLIFVMFLIPVQLNQETANDICIQLTSNESAIGSSENGKLICKIPTIDATHNIIIEGVKK